MRFRIDKRRQPPAVIIISLIDILIVLLIFMMVTTTFKQQQSAVKLALPESVQAKPGTDPAVFVVTVAKQEPYFYLEREHGATPVTLDRLTGELKQRASANPKLVLSVKADKEAPFGQIIRVMDVAKEAKVKSINAFIKPGNVR